MNKSVIILTYLLIASLATYSQSIKKIGKSEISENCYSNRNYFKASTESKNRENAKGILLLQALNALQSQISSAIQVNNEDNKVALSNYLKMNNLDYMSAAAGIKGKESENYTLVCKLMCNQHIIQYQIKTTRELTNETEKITRKEEFYAPKDKNWYNDVIEELENMGFEFHSTYEENIYRACISIKKDLIKKE